MREVLEPALYKALEGNLLVLFTKLNTLAVFSGRMLLIPHKLRPGYREKRKEAAKLAARFIGATEEMERTQSQLNKLEQQRRTFEQWQTSPQTMEMERLRDYLSTKEAQTRRHEIKAQQVRELAREIEQQRQAQQRQPQQKPEQERGWGMSL